MPLAYMYNQTYLMIKWLPILYHFELVLSLLLQSADHQAMQLYHTAGL